MADQGEGGAAVARDHIEKASRHTAVGKSACNPHRGAGSGRMGFDHDGVARRQRRCDLLAQQVGGRIERRDGGHHAQGHMAGEAEVAGACGHGLQGQDLAAHVQHFPGAGAYEVNRALNLAGRHPAGLAHVGHDEIDHLGGGSGQRIAGLGQPLRALRQCGAAMLLIGRMGQGDHLGDHRLRCFRNLGHGLAGAG